jgi:putative oxidoreductase
MNNTPSSASEPKSGNRSAAGSAFHFTKFDSAKNARTIDWQRLAILYARLALGAAFLSGIADRFGLYTGRNVGYGNFAGFVQYTAKVNSFMPASTIPFLAWAATVAEFSLGLALVFGIWLRGAALGSAVVLALFGTAMAISFGIKSPSDYSVFSASAASVLVALFHSRNPGANS